MSGRGEDRATKENGQDFGHLHNFDTGPIKLTESKHNIIPLLQFDLCGDCVLLPPSQLFIEVDPVIELQVIQRFKGDDFGIMPCQGGENHILVLVAIKLDDNPTLQLLDNNLTLIQNALGTIFVSFDETRDAKLCTAIVSDNGDENIGNII